jgi:hypothetical protein
MICMDEYGWQAGMSWPIAATFNNRIMEYHTTVMDCRAWWCMPLQRLFLPYIGKPVSRKVITGFQAVSNNIKCSWESAWAAPARPISHSMCHMPFDATRSFTGASLTAKQLTGHPSMQNNSSPNTVLLYIL